MMMGSFYLFIYLFLFSKEQIEYYKWDDAKLSVYTPNKDNCSTKLGEYTVYVPPCTNHMP